jgi:GlcNAc-P-P-Und epimerase
MDTNTKILITGGSGFIGTNLLQKLVQDGYEVLNMDSREPKEKDLKRFWKKVEITDLSSLKTGIEQFAPTYIVHLAARTDLNGHSLDDYSTNILGVENLMNIAKSTTSLKKILITSSMLVCKAGYQPKGPLDFSPTTFYGESKVETEKIVWANQPPCNWVIIRPTSIWGPCFKEPYKNFFDRVIAGKYYHIGRKSCTKTYGYIGNAVYQIEQLLFSEEEDNTNRIFYIGDYEAMNIEDWANEIAFELGKTIIRIPYPLMKMAAICGDLFKLMGIPFPMSSFRLKNMTTNNIVDMTNTRKMAPNLPYSRIEGIKATLKWMSQSNVSE